MGIENFELYQSIRDFLGEEIRNWNYIHTMEKLLNIAKQQSKELVDAQERELSYIDDIEQMEGMLGQANNTINQYQLQETLLLERLKKQTLEIKEMKNDRRLIRFWELAEENLRLAQELASLKGEKASECTVPTLR